MIASEFFDKVDRRLCRAGLLRPGNWNAVRTGKVTKLYAGSVFRALPQFKTHIGITPFEWSTHNIFHDIREPMPIPDNSIELFQSEDVFEHIPYSQLGPILEDIFRVLKPGGLLRMSVPDYRCPVLRDRSVKNAAGEILFDPGGGGNFVDGIVTDGGDVWFPIYETVRALLAQSSFSAGGSVKFLHYTLENGESILHDIDYSVGHVKRTPDHDDRVRSPRCAMSIVVEATKAK